MCIQECDEYIHHHISCDYTNNGFQYRPNPNITCQRDDLSIIFSEDCTICQDVVDCCAINSNECCIPGSTSIPTSIPTSQPTPLCGNGEVHYFQESEMCNFIETRNKDITTMFDASMMCCSSERSECCIIKSNEIVIGLSCFIALMLFCVYVHLHQHCVKVVPDTQTPKKKDMNNCKILPV